MEYESVRVVASAIEPSVKYTIAKLSFARRVELMRAVRELAAHNEFLAAGKSTEDQMDSALVQAEIDRLYLRWGLRCVAGLTVDGKPADADVLLDSGPEEFCREALKLVRAEAGLSEQERKN